MGGDDDDHMRGVCRTLPLTTYPRCAPMSSSPALGSHILAGGAARVATWEDDKQ